MVAYGGRWAGAWGARQPPSGGPAWSAMGMGADPQAGDWSAMEMGADPAAAGWSGMGMGANAQAAAWSAMGVGADQQAGAWSAMEADADPAAAGWSGMQEGADPQAGTWYSAEAGAKAVDANREAKIKAKMNQIRTAAKNQSLNAQVTAPAQKEQKQAAATADSAKEDADAQKLEKMLPPLQERISSLEDEVERVAIVGAPLNMEASRELRELQKTAMQETERVTQEALSSVDKVRKELEKRQREVASFAPIAQEGACKELNKLQGKLESVQQRLDEFKTVRSDYDLAVDAEKAFGELNIRLARIEMDCEKGATMAEPLQKVSEVSPLEINTAEIKDARQAVNIAQALLAPTSRLISNRVPGLKGAMLNKMLELKLRADSAHKMLEKAQAIVGEASSRASAGPILQKAYDHLQKVELMIASMRETEGPFLMGIESLPGDEGCEVIAAMDDAAIEAEVVVKEGQQYVASKLDEVGRLNDSVAEAVRAQLATVKESLSSSLTKVRSFQAEVGNRKRANMVELVQLRLQDAESAAEKLKEAGEALRCASEEEVWVALDNGKLVEQQLHKAIAAAMRQLKEKLPDMKNAAGAKSDAKNATEMLKAKTRVHALDTELSKFRKQLKDTEEKQNVDKSLSEVSDKLKSTEAEVEQITEMSEGWPYDAKISTADEAFLKTVQGKLTVATNQVEKRLQKSQGLELKELRAIFNRLKSAQEKLNRVKSKAGRAARDEGKKELKSVSDILQSAEGKLRELGSANSSASTGLANLEELEQLKSSLMACVSEAQGRLEEMNKQSLAPEIKVDFARLQVRCKGVVSRAKLAASNFNSKFDEASRSCIEELVNAFRKIAKQEDGTFDADSLFTEIAGEAVDLSAEKCVNYFLARQPEIDDERVRFAFRRMAPYGLSKPGLVSLLVRFVKVTREVALTDVFDITTARKKRGLKIGEVLEVITEETEDKALRLSRIQCRSISDGLVGWVTIKGVSGSLYLEGASKPLLWLSSGGPLTAGPEEGSNVIRDLLPQDVVELVEGPREEKLGSDKRVRGRACKQNEEGWLQVESKEGKVLAKVDKNVYICIDPIALTDVSDFENCTVQRRVEAGEVLEKLPHPDVTPAEGGSRGMFRACKDGAVGWVTIVGSQTTQYLRPAPMHYVCLQATPLHTDLGADSAVTSVLMPGEAFEAFDEPQEVSGDVKAVYKVRTQKDGIVGWVSSTPENKMLPWHKRYTVQRTVNLTNTLAANEAAENVEVVRVLQPNEHVEASEPPIEDRTTGQLRLRCSALSDKVAGWVTVRDGPTNSALVMLTMSSEKAATTNSSKTAVNGKGAHGKGGVKRSLVAVKEEVEEPRKSQKI